MCYVQRSVGLLQMPDGEASCNVPTIDLALAQAGLPYDWICLRNLFKNIPENTRKGFNRRESKKSPDPQHQVGCGIPSCWPGPDLSESFQKPHLGGNVPMQVYRW